jgi:competence protein ComEA
MTPLLARCALGATGLVLLAGIGRSALAGGSASSTAPGGALSLSAAPPAQAPHAMVGPAQAPAPPPPAAATSPPAAAPTADAGSANGGAPTSTSAARRATPDDPVYLNQAALEDLRRLPGVGPKRAQAILALRQRLGRFRQIEDLLKVKGIGRASLRKLRPLVRIEGGPVDAP